jgi:translocation and assembly module TamA
MYWKNSPFLASAGLLLWALLLVPPPLFALPLEVEVEGLREPALGNVLALLSVQQRRQADDLTVERLRHLHRQAEREIRTALQPFGYYRPSIVSALHPPAADREQWLASYRIDPGQQVLIQALDIQLVGVDAKQPPWQQQLAQIPLKTGQPLLHAEYEKGKRQLLLFAQDQGYLDAAYSVSRIEVDPESASAAIQLHLAVGPRYRFGDARIEQGIFDDDFVRRYLTFDSETALTRKRLAQLRRELSATGYFSQVTINADQEQADADHRIPVEIKLAPAKPNKYRARLGYGTDSGLGLRMDWKRRYLTRHGHHFNLGAIAVQEKNKLIADFNYQIPIQPRENTYLELGARHEGKALTYSDIGLEEGDETRLSSQQLKASLHRPRQLFGLELDEVISIGYVTDRYDIFEVLFGHFSSEGQTFIEQYIGQDNRSVLSPDYQALVPEIEWIHQRSNDPIFPSDGEYLSLALRGAVEGALSDVSFFQMDLEGIFIRELFGNDRLIARGQAAWTDVESRNILGMNVNLYPESYEFRTGGDRTVRGYGYESLAGDDAITGGKHLLVGSIEYEKKILPQWSLATFFDTGNAFNDIGDIGAKSGAGVGARWYSPVGLVRLDLAFALDDDGTPWRIHFRIGPEF